MTAKRGSLSRCFNLPPRFPELRFSPLFLPSSTSESVKDAPTGSTNNSTTPSNARHPSAPPLLLISPKTRLHRQLLNNLNRPRSCLAAVAVLFADSAGQGQEGRRAAASAGSGASPVSSSFDDEIARSADTITLNDSYNDYTISCSTTSRRSDSLPSSTPFDPSLLPPPHPLLPPTSRPSPFPLGHSSALPFLRSEPDSQRKRRKNEGGWRRFRAGRRRNSSLRC